MFKNFLLLLFLAGNPALLFSQTVEATTQSGKKVILFPDGTWKYAADIKPEAKEKEVKVKPEEKKEEKKKTEPKKPVAGIPVSVPDCADEVELNEDSKTGIRTWRSRSMIVVAEPGGKKEIGILFQKNSKGILTVFLRPVGAGECIGEGNKINIVFGDGSKLELTHDGFANCRGEAAANFGSNWGRKKQLEELKTKKIKSIRVWTQQGSVQQTLTDENAEQFLKMFNCLSGQ